jgi:hypothetical protein
MKRLDLTRHCHTLIPEICRLATPKHPRSGNHLRLKAPEFDTNITPQVPMFGTNAIIRIVGLASLPDSRCLDLAPLPDSRPDLRLLGLTVRRWGMAAI